MSHYFSQPPPSPSSSQYFSSYPSTELPVNTSSREVFKYLSLDNVDNTNILRDPTVENRIHYSNGNHVNVTIERLVGVLLSTIPNDQSKSVFQKFAGLLVQVISAQNSKTSGRYLYESLFSSTIKSAELNEEWRMQGDQKAEEYVPKAEKTFLDQIITSLKKSNFQCLSLTEINLLDDFSKENAVFTKPVEINWDELDGGLLSSYYDKLFLENEEEAQSHTVPGYKNRCLLFWRGISVEEQVDYFRLQKFDLLLQKITEISGLNKFRKILSPDSKETEAGDYILSANAQIKKEKKTHKLNQSFSEEDIKNLYPNSLERKSLQIGCAPKDFFKQEIIEEPAFDELIIIHRPKKRAENPNAIFIQRFNNVQMKDFANIFPVKLVRKNFADYFYFIMIFIWISTLSFKLMNTWSSATYIDEAVIGILLIFLPLLIQYISKSILSLRTHVQHRNLASDIFKSSLNCNKSVLSYLRDEATQQESLSILLAYYLLSNSPMSLAQLQFECEKWLNQRFFLDLHFSGASAFDFLVKYNIIYQKLDGIYYAHPADLVIPGLEKVLSVAAEEAFKPVSIY